MGVVGVRDRDGLLSHVLEAAQCAEAVIFTFAVPIIFCGSGGRICFLCDAWNAATRVEFWKAGLNWAMAALGRTKADMTRCEAVGAWRKTEGRMRDAIAVVVVVQVRGGLQYVHPVDVRR